MALFVMLTVVPARAQYPGGGSGYPGGGYPGGGWSVHDQAGNAINANSDGSGYPLRGPSTGTYNLSGAYPSVLTAAQKPNAVTGYAFLPNPNDYQGWLFSSGTTAPGDGYDPFHLWINAAAYNNVGNKSGGTSGYLGSYSTGYQYVNGGITASVGGTLWAVFQWSGANPPDHLDILLSTTLRASASVSTYGSPARSDGLTSSATATDSLNETASASGGVPLVTSRHLLRVPVDPSTGKASVSLGGTSTATASNSVLYGAFGNYPGTTSPGYYQVTDGPTGAASSASIGATARQDSRDVIITSTDIENSAQRGAIDAQHSSGIWPDVRNRDGSIVTDSAVSPPLNQPGGGTNWTASPTLWAQAVGFQSPIFAWSVSGSGSSSAGNSNHTVLSVTFPVSATGKALSKQSTATVNVTDSDGATAANTFTVRWHYPYENWQTSSAAFQNAPSAYHSTDGPQGANGQVHIPVSVAKTDWSVAGKVGSGLLATAAAVIPEADPILLGFMAATGTTLGSLNPPPPPTTYSQQGTQSQFQSDVGTELSINSGSTSGVFMPSVARMPPTFAQTVSASGNYSGYMSGGALGTLTFDATAYRLQWQQNYVGDAYGVKGYTGLASAYVRWEGGWQYVFQWTWTPAGHP